MLTAALAGCMSDDTSELDTRISELEQSNIELNENLATAQTENAHLQSSLDQSVQDYSDLQVSLAAAEVNAMDLQAQLEAMTESRDSLVIALDGADEFAEEILAVIDSMNATMATLYDALVENATLAQQWQMEARSSAADLRYAVLMDASLYNVNLYGADLRASILDRANMRNSILINADLTDAGLENVELSGAQMIGAKTGSIIPYGSCPSSLPTDYRCVDGSTDSGTLLRSLMGPGADLSDSAFHNFQETTLNLEGANMQSSDFYNLNMNGANMVNADLSGATLENVNLYNSDLTGADLTGVVWINVMCPDGGNSGDNGNTCENNL